MRAVVIDEETIVDGKVTVLKVFSSEHEASEYIATLPDYERGRYGLDIIEDSPAPHLDMDSTLEEWQKWADTLTHEEASRMILTYPLFATVALRLKWK